MTVPPYPWQKDDWDRMHVAALQGRLTHALLIVGVIGDGHSEFANCLISAFLCEKHPSDAAPCGSCSSCTLLAAATHPDYLSVELTEDTKAIKIDQIRGVAEFLALKPHSGKRKLVRIEPADAMNPNAANSLLKTLEEPPLGSLLILVTARPGSLPATVLSRCQRVHPGRGRNACKLDWLKQQLPGSTSTETLLKLAGGAPLRAVELASDDALSSRSRLLSELCELSSGKADPLRVAEAWERVGFDRVSSWLLVIVEDLIRCGLDAHTDAVRNDDLCSELTVAASKLRLVTLFDLRDRLLQYRAWVATSSGLATLNLFEELTMTWMSHASALTAK